MDKGDTSTKNSLNEVLVKVKDDIDSRASRSSIVSEEVARDHKSYGAFRHDPCCSIKRKFGPEKDYAWFVEDDFNIDCLIEEMCHRKKNFPQRSVQWILLVILLVTLVCTLTISVLEQLELWGVSILKWEVLFLATICGELVASFGVRVIVSLIESTFYLRIGVLYIVYGAWRSFKNVVWLSLVTIVWHFIVVDTSVKESKSQLPRILQKIMLCLLMGTLIWLLKTIIVKALAGSFHLISFFRRIRVSLYKQYVIKKLGGELVECRNREETCFILSRRVLGKKKVTALKVKRMIKIVQAGDLPRLSNMDEDLPIRSNEEDEDESSLRAKYDREKDRARDVFQKVAQQSTRITVEDLRKCLGEDKLSKVKELFAGTMCNDQITEEGFTDWMIDAYTERRTLALSVNDAKTAVDDLHHMMNAIVSITILITWLIIMGAPVTHFLIFVTTQLAIGVYIFGEMGKKVFESIIFLFVMHPYDIGDRCEVDGIEVIVDEMTILTTVFLRHDGQKVIYPNNVLATKSIGNYSRSRAMRDEIEFSIDISTPWKKIEDMKKEIKEYFDKQTDFWLDDAIIIVKDVEELDRVKMVLWFKYVVSHHDTTQRRERRSELIIEMIRVFRELEIEYKI